MATGGVRRRDVLVAAGTTAAGLALLWGAPALLAEDLPEAAGNLPVPFSAGWSVTAGLLLAQGAALLRARTAPRSTLLLVAALAAVSSVVLPAELRGICGPAVLVAVVVAVVAATTRVWPALTAATATLAVGEVLGGVRTPGAALAPTVLDAVLQAVGLVALPALVALVVRSRLDVQRARQDEQAALLRERDALVEAAVSRERTAMARELHDIAAHHLSGIALMAAVVDRQIETDPARARQGVQQIRSQSTSVLDDLRRLVGLLREDAAAARQVESVATIADLVERVRPTQPVTLDVRRREAPLAEGVGPLAQLAAYRTTQEALSNAAVHAPGADCSVDVDDRDPARLRLRIRNAAPAGPAAAGGSAGGFGLRGMQERADLVGATVHIGPTFDGGWQVELLVPREPSTAADPFPTEQETV